MNFLRGFRFFSKRRLAQAYHNVFTNSEDGKIVLHDLLRAGHYFRGVWDADSDRKTSFMNGERNMVLRILGYVNMTDEEITRLAQEAKYYQIGETENE